MSDPCQPIRDALAKLLEERTGVQETLQSGLGPAQKAAALREIGKLTGKIEDKEDELNECLGIPPPPPPLPPVTCSLTGTAIQTISDPRFPGATVPISLSLTFTGIDHRNVSLPIPSLGLTSFFLLFGRCNDFIGTQQASAGGTFDLSSGHMDIPVTLTVFHTVSGNPNSFPTRELCHLFISSGPSTLSGTLTTRSTASAQPTPITPTLFGAPLNRQSGAITLVGAGVLAGGASAGTAVDVIISGTLSQPLP
jgi:hypothetical protein